MEDLNKAKRSIEDYLYNCETITRMLDIIADIAKLKFIVEKAVLMIDYEKKLIAF